MKNKEFITSKYEGWALIGARAAIRMNMVILKQSDT